MAEKELAKCDFKNEYPIFPDIKKDKIRLDKLDNGYFLTFCSCDAICETIG